MFRSSLTRHGSFFTGQERTDRRQRPAGRVGRCGFAVGIVFIALARLGAQDLEIAGDPSINRCEAKVYTLTLQNDSGNPLTRLVATGDLSLLTGFSYVPGSTSIRVNAGPVFCTADPAVGGGSLIWDLDALCGPTVGLDDGDTLSVTFQLQTACAAVSGSLGGRFNYDIAGTPSEIGAARAIQVLPGRLSIRKTPSVISQEVGQNVTWTIAVENTGLGTVRNVVVTDGLGAGLEYVASSPAGLNAGPTTRWDAAQVPGLALMVPGDIITLDVTVKVIACTGLDNSADARWGCNPATDCFDTAVDGGTATAVVQRIPRSPSLSLTPPDIGFSYCEDSGPQALSVENIGDGTARAVELWIDFSPLAVAASSVPYNAAGYFELPDIAAGGRVDVTFTLAYAGWCGGADLAGTLIWQPRYADDCGGAYFAPVEYSEILPATGTPGLSVDVTGAPDVISIGDAVTYAVTSNYSGTLNCGAGSVGAVTVTDTVPAGFTVVDAGGGTWVPGAGGTGGAVTWAYLPPATLATTLTLQAPLRDECETWCFTTFANSVEASVTDCCGCEHTAAASQSSAIVCEELVMVTRTATPATAERCSNILYTNMYAFDGSAGALLNELVFTERADHQQQYVPGSLTVTFDGGDVTGCVLVTDTTPGGTLTLDFSGCAAAAVGAKALVITYQLTITEATAAACGGTEFYAWSALQQGSTGSQCLVDGTIYEAVAVAVEAPAMSLRLSGLSTVVDRCRTETVTLTLAQTSMAANPRDVRLVLSGLNYYVVNPSAAICAGDVSPISCTPALVGDDFVWYFGDGFTGAGQSCVLQFQVQKRCSGGGSLEATAFFDDRCHDDGVYDDTCSVSGGLTPAAIRGGDLLVEVSPEVYQAASSSVEWKVFVTNRGAGTAANVWVDHFLGAGLDFSSAVVDDMTGVTVTADMDHTGGAVNGATVAIDALAPGERREISFHAVLIDTFNLTLDVAAAWGCVGVDCQSAVRDSSTVETLTPMLVDTAVVTTPVDACGGSTGTLTLRNAGQTACYNGQVTETLPAGLRYVSGTTRWRVNGGAWNGPDAAYDPNPTVSPLRWTATGIPGLAVLNPGDTLDVDYDLSADCPFTGGPVTVTVSYEDPGGQVINNPASTFSVAFRAPDLRVTKTRADQPVSCGELIEWTIAVENQSGYTLPIVWVEDTLDAAFTFNSSVGDPPYTADDGTFDGVNRVSWELSYLGPGETAILTLRASLDSSPCSPDLDNTVRAWWGCGTADGSSATQPGVDPPDNGLCLNPTPVSYVRTETRQPSLTDFAVGLSPASIDACNGGTEVTFACANTGTTDAFLLDVEISLPAGLTYNPGTARLYVGADGTGATTPIADPAVSGNRLIFFDTADKVNNLVDVLQAAGGSDTLVLKFELRSDCFFAADLGYAVRFYDCCGDTQYQLSGSQTVPALNPELTVTQAPASAQIACGGQQAWTITVTNTGAGNAQVVRIEDTPGAWITVDPGASTAGLTDLGSGKWGWEINDLASGGAQVFTLAGTLNPAGNGCDASRRENNVRAVWGCGTAGDATDGDPLTQSYDCTSAVWATAPTAILRLPNLAVGAVAPAAACAADGSFTGSIAVSIVNAGDGSTGGGFLIQAADGQGWTGTFACANILAAGETLNLDIPGSSWSPAWVPACTPCAAASPYSFTVVLDPTGAVCGCDESDNALAGILFDVHRPELAVTDIDFALVACSGDQVAGAIRVRVDNTGCADAAGVVVRLTADCGLTFGDQITNVPAGSHTLAEFPIVDGAWNDCADETCAFTVAVDPAGLICECVSGGDTLGPVTHTLSLPDLEVTDIELGALSCDSGVVSGSASVTVRNAGSGAAGAFSVSLSTPAGLAFTDQPVAALAAGESITLVFPAAGSLPDCCLCAADFTAAADAAQAVCECRGDNNVRTVRPAAADKIYWTDESAGAIQRAEADGASVEAVLAGLAGPRAVTLDGTGGKMYWLEPAGGVLRRSNLDGTDPETLLDSLSAPVALALDPAAGLLYWTDAAGVHRAGLDGADPENLIPSVTDAAGIAVDSITGRLYFAQPDGRIRGANLDGNDLQEVIAGLGSPFGLALDIRNGMLIFSDPLTGLIQRIYPDGTGLTTVLGGLESAVGCLALNAEAETVYYETRGAAIRRVGLDGAGDAAIVDGLDQSGGVAVLKLNTAPTATEMNQTRDYLQGAATVPLNDIVVTDPDFCDTVMAVLILADPSLGGLSDSSGHGETYDAAAGRWTVTGSVADVNAALADVAFLPVPDNPDAETVTVRIRDASGAGPADGAVVLGVIPYPVISGSVRLNGAGVAGVAMNGLPGGIATDASGGYSAVLPHDWSGTVTPDLAGYHFTPSSRTYANVAVDQPDQDYTATAATAAVLVSEPNPSVFGDPVTLTVTVSSAAGPPPGTVRFLDGAVEIGSGTLSAGAAAFSTSLLSGGLHVLTAAYDGSPGYETSVSPPVNHPVNPAATATNLSSAPNPSVFGDAVTLTAVVSSGAGTPSGTVTFFEGATVLGSQALAGGVATVVIPSPPGGIHGYSAAYSGNADHQPSASAVLNHLVQPAPTATTLSSAPNPSVYGVAVTLTAVVVSPVPAPAGSVAFRDGVVVLGTVVLSGGGTAVFTTSALTGGTHSLTAEYLGTANHAASTSPAVLQTVRRAATATTVSSSVNPSRYGQPVTFTAAVAGPGSPPTGTVVFRADGADLGPAVPLSGGMAVLTTSDLAVGGHTITAHYRPMADPNHLPSEESLTGGQNVVKADTTTALTTSRSSRYGEAVNLTAVVAVIPPGSGMPSGTVTFFDGVTTLGTGTLSGGTATFTTTALAVGPHQLAARFEGNASLNPSVSPSTFHRVYMALTGTVLAAAPNPSHRGQTVTFTATVTATPPGAGTPTGTVTFRDDGVALGSAPLSNGTATWATAQLTMGTHPITAGYSGDENFRSSDSEILSQAVERAETATTLHVSPSPVCPGGTVTLTAMVSVVPAGEGTPTGSVEFRDGPELLGTVALDGNLAVSITLAAPEAGTLIVSAAYSGDGEFMGSSSDPLDLEVAEPPAVTLDPIPTTVGSWASAALTVEYSGTEPVSIQWYEGASGDTSLPVPGATEATLATPAVDWDTGYWARLQNDCGQTDSAAAAVTIRNTYYLAHVAMDDLWWTSLTAVNWSEHDHPVVLEAFGADGTLLETRTLDQLGSRCQLAQDASELFSAETLAQDVWVRTTTASDLKGLVAFGTTDGETQANLPFLKAASFHSAFPYVVTGVAGWYTGLTLVNTDETPASVRLTARDEDGGILSEQAVAIPGYGKYVRFLEEIFPDVADPTRLRNVRVLSDRRLVGFELFWNLDLAGLAGLPAVSMDELPPDGGTYDHFFNEIPDSGSYYTGITFVNLDQAPAAIAAAAFDAAGSQLGTEYLELPPGSQLTRELQAVFPPPDYAAAAYIRWDAPQRVTGFELVLTRDGEFLFDGLVGGLEPWHRLVFPAASPSGGSVRLRLTNQENLHLNLEITAYDAAGVALATRPADLDAYQLLDLNLGADLAPVAAEIAWVEVEGDGLMVGDAFIISADGKRLVIYAGFPAW